MTLVYADAWLSVHGGDARDVLRELEPESVHCVVTSPPYWGLRNYDLPPGVWGGDSDHDHAWGEIERGKRKDILPPDQSKSKAPHGSDARGVIPLSEGLRNHGGQFCACGAWLGCLGLEPDPALYVEHLVEVFRAIRRVLRSDGTAWLNLGDSFASDGKWGGATGGKHAAGLHGQPVGRTRRFTGLKEKDLIGVPWAVAFALRDDGWWLRSDIVWSKNNPMPESITDRPTRSHEFVFLLAKSARYHYDADAIAEPATHAREAKYDPGTNGLGGDDRRTGVSTRRFKVPAGWNAGDTADDRVGRYATPHAGGRRQSPEPGEPGAFTIVDGQVMRNKRSVWTIATQPYPGAHFATFPTELVRPMIRAGCPPGGVVLDCFAGTGTVGLVAQQEGRRAVLIDLNPDYLRQCLSRTAREFGVGGPILEDHPAEHPEDSLWAEAVR